MPRRLLSFLLIIPLALVVWRWLQPAPMSVIPRPETPAPAPTDWETQPGSERLANLQQRRTPDVTRSLKAKDFQLGDPVFIRVIKETSELELWLQSSADQSFRLYQSYHIARWSGTLGPKLQEGDGQAPEGFYDVNAARMNPQSLYHLAFNIGYPNRYDMAHQRTGSFIMVHGKEVSIGCFAMTDPVMEEIYLICHAALTNGQASFAVHCYPFRMTAERLAQAEGEWLEFWHNLKQGWDAFEQEHRPPSWDVRDGRYVFP